MRKVQNPLLANADMSIYTRDHTLKYCHRITRTDHRELSYEYHYTYHQLGQPRTIHQSCRMDRGIWFSCIYRKRTPPHPP